MDPASLTSCPSRGNSSALVRSLILNDSRFFFRGGVSVSILIHCAANGSSGLTSHLICWLYAESAVRREAPCFFSELLGSYREVGIPRMERISWRALTSRGERGGVSNQIIKSANLTSCSTRTSATDTFTVLAPGALPATHSLPRSAARPRATASYSVAAVTSTVCETPSRSWIVTRQERIGTSEKITYSLFLRHKGELPPSRLAFARSRHVPGILSRWRFRPSFLGPRHSPPQAGKNRSIRRECDPLTTSLFTRHASLPWRGTPPSMLVLLFARLATGTPEPPTTSSSRSRPRRSSPTNGYYWIVMLL